jgi:hypothetical protein
LVRLSGGTAQLNSEHADVAILTAVRDVLGEKTVDANAALERHRPYVSPRDRVTWTLLLNQISGYRPTHAGALKALIVSLLTC